MALIIKGDLPSCCAVCCDCNSADDGNFCNRTGNRLGNDWQLYRPLNCPILGEIPDNHGDLKDANAILRWLNAKADNRVPVTLGEIIDFIEKQPTVLEAST